MAQNAAIGGSVFRLKKGRVLTGGTVFTVETGLAQVNGVRWKITLAENLQLRLQANHDKDDPRNQLRLWYDRRELNWKYMSWPIPLVRGKTLRIWAQGPDWAHIYLNGRVKKEGKQVDDTITITGTATIRTQNRRLSDGRMELNLIITMEE